MTLHAMLTNLTFATLCFLSIQLVFAAEKRVYTTNSLSGFKKDTPALFPPGYGGKNASTRVILDIGANNGDDYTLRGYQAGHTVVAFEASPSVSLLFQRTMISNKIDTTLLHPSNKKLTLESTIKRFSDINKNITQNQVFLFPVGLSSKTSVSKFHQSPCTDINKCGKVNHLIDNNGNGQGIDVEVYKLDEVSLPVRRENIWFMKVDVEGYENEVLRGARQLIADAKIPYIGIEFAAQGRKGKSWGVSLLNTLHNYGYTCYHLRGFGSCHDKNLKSPSLKCNYPFSTDNKAQAPTFEQYSAVFEMGDKNEKLKPKMADLMCARSDGKGVEN